MCLNNVTGVPLFVMLKWYSNAIQSHPWNGFAASANGEVIEVHFNSSQGWTGMNSRS
ncbi:hypothetical protein J14TS5_04340 [Paenibacillus lautus]|nr:hypothetical protein J14TS5_04340 [Paenibacillus lautus]